MAKPAPSENMGQLGHPPSLISEFVVRMKKQKVPSFLLSAQRRLIILGSVLKKRKDCVDPDQTPSSPVSTLFADVLFHRILKTQNYTYLRFVVEVGESRASFIGAKF